LLGNLEQLDEAYRVLPEPLRARSTDLAGCDLISFEQPRPTAEAGEQTARAPALLRHLLVDVSQEHAGQMPNRLRLHEVVLHEALDRALSRSFGEVHPLCHFALDVEGQPVLGTARDRVKMAPHGQQKGLGAAKASVLL